MAPRVTTIRMEPHVQHRLKVFAAVHAVTAGQAIEALLDFADSGEFITDPVFRDRFAELLKMAVADVSADGGE